MGNCHHMAVGVYVHSVVPHIIRVHILPTGVAGLIVVGGLDHFVQVQVPAFVSKGSTPGKNEIRCGIRIQLQGHPFNKGFVSTHDFVAGPLYCDIRLVFQPSVRNLLPYYLDNGSFLRGLRIDGRLAFVEIRIKGKGILCGLQCIPTAAGAAFRAVL